MNTLPPEELTHTSLFIVFGLAATVLFAVALGSLTVSEARLAGLRRLGDAGPAVAVGVALFLFVAVFLISRDVVEHAAITDDEHTYQFIAQTLRTGSLTAPSPGSDLEFFREQFVVLTAETRYGKYPIGHPLLLAVGQAIGAESLVVPLVTALIVAPLYRLGAAVFGRPTALLGLGLFALSPQVLLTGATLLSQPASALCLVAGLACLLAAEGSERRSRWLVAAGTCLGYGILVRPLPGVLFVLTAAGYLAAKHPPAQGRRQLAARWLAFGIPPALFAGLMMLINRVQTGGAFLTGYHAFHLPGEAPTSVFGFGDVALQAMSLAGHLVRLNVWLFGWPLSLAFCVFARRTPRTLLLWGMVGAGWLYRLLSPKIGVGTTGPQYLFEIVPLLCLLTADGMVQLARSGRLRGLGLASAGRVVAVGVAGVLINLSMFLPIKLAHLGRTANVQALLPRMIAQHRVTNALVFHNFVAPPQLGLSWAFYPRVNSPRLDDDVLFVWFQRGDAAVARNIEFWKCRYPDRSAWYFGYVNGEPRLVPLETHVRALSTPADPEAPRAAPSSGRGPVGVIPVAGHGTRR